MLSDFVGKVVSGVDVEHFNSGAANDIKVVKIQFNDGSRIELTTHIRSQGDPKGKDIAGIVITAVA